MRSRAKREDYGRYYCGLCHTLGRSYGTLPRLLTSHDAVFLALLADGLMQQGAEPARCRCPLVPVMRRGSVEPGSSAMRFAAAVQILLADQYLADRAIEGKRLARFARPLATRHVTRARGRLAALGVDASPLSGFEAVQAAAEQQATADPEQAARPTADALSYVLGTIAELPGIAPQARQGEAGRALRRLGSALGVTIYLTDALDDLAADERSGEFNPCLRAEPAAMVLSEPRGRLRRHKPARRLVDAGLVERAIVVLRSSLQELQVAFSVLPLARHRELLASIVQDQLVRHVRRAVAKARAHVAADSTEGAVARWFAWAFALRLLQPVMLALTVAFSWLLGTKAAFAEGTRKRPSLPPAAGAKDAGPDAGLDAGPDAGPDAGASGPGGSFWPSFPGPSPSSTGAGTGPAAPGGPGATGQPESSDEGSAPGSGSGASRPGGGGKASPCPSCGKCPCDKCCDCQGIIDGCCKSCTDPCKGCCNNCSCGKDCCNCPCQGGGGCCCK